MRVEPTEHRIAILERNQPVESTGGVAVPAGRIGDRLCLTIDFEGDHDAHADEYRNGELGRYLAKAADLLRGARSIRP